MSGSFPSSPGLADLEITSFAPTMVSTGHDQTRQVRSRGIHRWLIEGNLPRGMKRAVFAPVFAFMVGQRGQFETFTFTPPELGNTQGTASSVTVNGGSQTGRTVNINTLSGNLKAMDFIKFANHAKVYMLMADAANGATSLSIEPALITSPAHASAITVNSVPFTVAFTADTAKLALRPPLLAGTKISMIEVP